MVPWTVVPTAGSGTRLLPASAVLPKVMLPVGLCPMVHWAVRESALAGVRALLVIVSPHQPLIRQYLEYVTRPEQVEPRMVELRDLLQGVELHFVEQAEPRGVGDALIRCKAFTGTDPFAVVLPDNWFDSVTPAVAQVASTFEATGTNAIGLTEVRAADAGLYGNVGGVDLEPISGPAFRILALQDKQPGKFSIQSGPKVLRGCGRACLPASHRERGAGGAQDRWTALRRRPGGGIPGRCRLSVSIAAHHSDHDSLHAHLTLVDDECFHGRVGRLEPDVLTLSEVFFEGDLLISQQRDDRLTVVGRRAILDDSAVVRSSTMT